MRKNKIIAGTHNDQFEYAEKIILKSFQLIRIYSDQRTMTSAFKEALAKFKKNYKDYFSILISKA